MNVTMVTVLEYVFVPLWLNDLINYTSTGGGRRPTRGQYVHLSYARIKL